MRLEHHRQWTACPQFRRWELKKTAPTNYPTNLLATQIPSSHSLKKNPLLPYPFLLGQEGLPKFLFACFPPCALPSASAPAPRGRRPPSQPPPARQARRRTSERTNLDLRRRGLRPEPAPCLRRGELSPARRPSPTSGPPAGATSPAAATSSAAATCQRR